MKRILVIMAVLSLACFSVFAGFSVQAGPAYDYENTSFYVKITGSVLDANITASGFGAELEGSFDLNDQMEAYLNVTAVFPQEYKVTINNASAKIKRSLTLVSLTPGISYNIAESSAFYIKLGSGLTFNTFSGEYTYSNNIKMIGDSSFGIHAGFSAGVNVSEKVAIGAKGIASALIYHISFCDVKESSATVGYSQGGFRFGYNLTGSVGVTVRF